MVSRTRISRTRMIPHLVLLTSFALVASAGPSLAEATDSLGLRGQDPGGGNSDHETHSKHWPVDPQEAEYAFAHAPLRIVSEQYAGRGLTGALRVTVELLETGKQIPAKWKPAPRRLDALNNSPRRELAAYEVQKLFLDPPDYVVPTSKLRCLFARDFAEPEEHRVATIRGTHCRIGVLSLWLDEVTLPDPLLDRDRFAKDPLYARYLADFNLATYLMKHADGRLGNFLVAKNDGDRRVFAIDNGVAFSGIAYNWFVPNWKRLRVPALRRESVDRLRRLSEADLQPLGVVAQMELAPRRGVRSVEPTRNLDPEAGVRSEGRVIQLGLDEDEIENLWERIEHLIEDVDRGRVEVF